MPAAATRPHRKLRYFAEPNALMGTDVNTGCSPLHVQFTQLSSGGVTGVFWNFGDGSTSTAPAPGSHTFVTGSNDTRVHRHVDHTNRLRAGHDVYRHSCVAQYGERLLQHQSPAGMSSPWICGFTNYSTGGTINEWFLWRRRHVSNQTSPTHV